MGELIAKLLSGLGTILRYIAPGFVALLVAIWVDKDFDLFKTPGHCSHPSWAIPVAAALTGVFIYAIHVGFLVRPLWWLVVQSHKWRYLRRYSRICEKDNKRPTCYIMWDLDTQRWKRRASSNEEIKAVQEELDKWSALLNFLYCSGYATIVVPILVKCFRCRQAEEHWETVSLLGFLVLAFALISEWRETNRELWATKEYRDGGEAC
ncbi:MAG: hypothetical protein JSW66_06545 [Phycisphaerales bacterium]|nr:MAG: hypothetical protein JSW66_06545 [Phycisphaerales bacterium]